jgi:hypothetical protein
MLGRVVGHADECAQLFHLFLKADLPLARAMLVPRAFQVRTLHNSLPRVLHDTEESGNEHCAIHALCSTFMAVKLSKLA